MKNLLLIILLPVILFQSCRLERVTRLRKNGYFSATRKAEIITSKKIDLDEIKTLLVVPTNKYILKMVQNINYFDEVITIRTYRTRIQKMTNDDSPVQLKGKEGLKEAYDNYWSFLWLRYFKHTDENHYTEIKLINPKNYEEIFIARTHFHYVPGAWDYNAYRPLLNGLIDYIKENSATYRR